MVNLTAEQELMTVAEVAGMLRISGPRAYALIEEAGIPYVRLSARRIRIPRSAFEDWLTARTFRAERQSETPSH